ncbi:MAG: DNA polymerase III subunit delta' [Desulfobacterales bacterium]
MADLDLAYCHNAYGRLKRLHQSGRLPHAILLSGLSGVGKKATAIQLAMAFNCRRGAQGNKAPGAKSRTAGSAEGGGLSEACGVCLPCRQIQAGQYPDVIRIDPTGTQIKIGQIRELLSTLAMKPYGEGLRLVMVTDAAAMNPSAANALLKILEEPPERTVLILMTVQADGLLPTIRSRCQEIRLAPLPEDYIRKLLQADHPLADSAAQAVAALAQGSQARALEMARPQWQQRRAGLLQRIAGLSALSLSAKLIWAEKLTREPGDLNDFLDIAQSWLRDLSVSSAQAGGLLNCDYADLIHRESVQTGSAARVQSLKSLAAVRQAIRRTNPNLRLLVEALVLDWNA